MVYLYLKAKNFKMLKNWRLKQERKLWVQTKNKKNLKIMSSGRYNKFYADLSKNYTTNV